MTDVPPHVQDEIEDHKADLDKWINNIAELPCAESRKGVSERFVRDCKILKEDLDAKETPTAADLVDFTDRHNSLEIQYINITSDLP